MKWLLVVTSLSILLSGAGAVIALRHIDRNLVYECRDDAAWMERGYAGEWLSASLEAK